MKAWYPDEQGFAGSEHLDARYVTAYDRKAKYDPSEDITILREVGLTKTSTVLDLGAGTGVLPLPSPNIVIMSSPWMFRHQ